MKSQSAIKLGGTHSPQRGGGTWRTCVLWLAALVVLLPAMSIDLQAAPGLNRNPGWPGVTLSGVPCYGDGTDSRFDYISERNRIGIVEKFHFYREIQQLTMHDNRLDGDLDYTLRSIPNHHQALWVRSKFYMRSLKNDNKRQEMERKERLRQGKPPPECYFQRGKVFNPRDGMVPAIYGIYLHKRGAHEAALTEYKSAEELLPAHSELIYNMGLLYLDMGNLEKAREYADKARDLGYPLKGLRRKLEAAAAEAKPEPEPEAGAEQSASATN